MKKIIIILIAGLLLVGCSNKKKEASENLLHYETSWKALLNESKFNGSSRHFDISTQMYEENGSYSYYIEINNPRMAMYNIEVMVIENKEPFNVEEKMLPSLGIFDDPINLVPYQVDVEKGFLEGILLGREGLSTPSVVLQLMVTWTNNTQVEAYKEVLELNLSYVEAPLP